MLTRELLTEGYGVPIESGRNPETGHADIYTIPEPMDEAKLRLLETIIGDNTGKDVCNGNSAEQLGRGGKTL